VSVVGRPPLSAVSTRGLSDEFARAGYGALDWCTSVVHLVGDEATLLASFDRSVGKAIRRCVREGVSVRRCEDLDAIERDFYGTYAATAAAGYDVERGRTVHALDRGRHYDYYVAAAADGSLLACLGTYRYGGVATEIMSARSPEAVQSAVPVQDLLHWEVMRSRRDAGDEWFDLAGYASTPTTPKEEGIRRFKEKWNGVRVASPTFTKDVSGRLRRATRRLRGTR